ncbi:S8 family serine peptidase [Myxococcaceae bacterium GXIMD 01537]
MSTTPTTPGLHYTGGLHVKLREPEPMGVRLSAKAPRRRSLAALARAAGLRAEGPLLEDLPRPSTGRVRASADLPWVEPAHGLSRWHTLRLPPSRGGGSRVAMAVTEPAVASADEVWDAVRALMEQPDVEYAEPEAVLVHPVQPLPEVRPANLPKDWHLKAIRAPRAWRLFEKVGRRPGEGVLVAHLDTGWTPHPALPGPERMGPGVDLWDRDRRDASDPLEEGPGLQPGHGTGTLGLLAGNCRDYQGVAPYVSVLPVRVSPSVIHVGTRSLALGILHAVSQGAHVISISMGGLPSRLWADAVNYAYERGVVVVGAAGNHFPLPGGLRTPTSVVYPARFGRVLAVSGMTHGCERYRFSDRMSGNDGPEVDLCAPTPDVLWAKPGGGYHPGTGTSTATPQVAGAAALWLSYHREALADLPPMERVEACRRALLVGAADVGPYPYHAHPSQPGRTHNDYFGEGRLDVEAALQIKPVRGLRPQPPDDVSWALLRLLGVSTGEGPGRSQVPADEIELLWATHAAGVQQAVHASLSPVLSERLRARLELA